MAAPVSTRISLEDPGLFERLLFDIITRTPGAVPEAIAEDVALVHFPGRTKGVLVRHVPEHAGQIQAAVRTLIKRVGAGGLEVALVGGPRGASVLVTGARPWFTGARVFFYQLHDDGTLWSDSTGKALVPRPMLEHLRADLPRGPVTADDWSRFVRHLETGRVGSPATSVGTGAPPADLAEFAARFRARRPVGTYVLTGIIAATFLLQLLFGALESVPGLVRMGGLVPELVQAGELWRLFSSAFLHASVMHFALNTYVLYMVGNSQERILGTSRFLALFFLSVLGSSVASLLLSDANVMVGASGGLWGLLGADMVLAFKPRGLLPQSILPRARRAATLNLGINAVVSLLPHVAAAAHFGGGRGGAALMGTGILVRGIPRLEEPRGAPEQRPIWVVPMAWMGSVVLVLSLGVALGTGRAWELGGPPPMALTRLEGLGLQVELPAGLARQTRIDDPSEEEREVVFGHLPRDPAVVGLKTVAFPKPLPEEGLEGALDAVQEGVLQGAGFGAEGPATRIEVHGHPGLVTRYRAPSSDLRLEKAAVVTPESLWSVEVVSWPEHDEAFRGMARRILESMAPLPPGGSPRENP